MISTTRSNEAVPFRKEVRTWLCANYATNAPKKSDGQGKSFSRAPMTIRACSRKAKEWQTRRPRRVYPCPITWRPNMARPAPAQSPILQVIYQPKKKRTTGAPGLFLRTLGLALHPLTHDAYARTRAIFKPVYLRPARSSARPGSVVPSSLRARGPAGAPPSPAVPIRPPAPIATGEGWVTQRQKVVDFGAHYSGLRHRPSTRPPDPNVAPQARRPHHVLPVDEDAGAREGAPDHQMSGRRQLHQNFSTEVFLLPTRRAHPPRTASGLGQGQKKKKKARKAWKAGPHHQNERAPLAGRPALSGPPPFEVDELMERVARTLIWRMAGDQDQQVSGKIADWYFQQQG